MGVNVISVNLEVSFLFTPFHIYTSEGLNPHPCGGALYKYVTGNLLENSTAARIEFFKGVKRRLYMIISIEYIIPRPL